MAKKKSTNKARPPKTTKPESAAPPEKDVAEPTTKPVDDPVPLKEPDPVLVPHVVLRLRGASRSWPKKIGKFIERNQGEWIYTGKPIPWEIWNRDAEAIADEIKSNYDSLLPPAFLIEMVAVNETLSETPTWKKNLEKARPPKPEIKDENPRTQPASSEGSLY